jgi:quercetin dioxygenase-like cupin family protein
MSYFYEKFEEDHSQFYIDTHDASVKAYKVLGIPPAEDFRISLAKFPPGTVAHPHTHEWEHAMYILKGTAKATIQGEEGIIKEGMLAFVPRNTLHSIENIGKDELIVFGVSGPPRTEAGFAQLKKTK